MQVIRGRRSSGSFEIIQDTVYKKKESDKDSLGDDKLSSSDSDDDNNVGTDAPDGLDLKVFENFSHIF